jgi:prophage tail gpP-like protein
MIALDRLPYAIPGVVLLTGGRLYREWTSVEVRRSVKEMAGEFTLHVEERWSGGAGGPAALSSARISPGDPCQVFYDGVLAVTGYVDAYNPRYSSTHHSVTIQGRSKTGDLCDSSVEIPNGEMHEVTLPQAIRQAVSPFGIDLVVDATLSGVIDRVRPYAAETVHRFVDRYARAEGVCATDTPDGKLRLLHVEDSAPVASLTEGVNILEASAMLREDQRHSEYQVLGQDHGTDREFGRPVATRKSRATDGRVKRHRPLRLLNETKTSRRHARSRGAWEAARRAGESVRAEIKVVGWFAAPGLLWLPGQIVQVAAPMLALERTLAIETVTLMQSERGTLTALSLVPVEALNPRAGARKGDGEWDGTKPDDEPEDLTDDEGSRGMQLGAVGGGGGSGGGGGGGGPSIPVAMTVAAASGDWTPGQAISPVTITATGAAPLSFAALGLPAGLVLAATGALSATITGTPTGAISDAPIVIRITDAAGVAHEFNFAPGDIMPKSIAVKIVNGDVTEVAGGVNGFAASKQTDQYGNGGIRFDETAAGDYLAKGHLYVHPTVDLAIAQIIINGVYTHDLGITAAAPGLGTAIVDFHLPLKNVQPATLITFGNLKMHGILEIIKTG